MNKPRRTDYADTEFRDMIRGVSNERERVYFSDVDFVEYVYENNTRRYVCLLEAKRMYQIREGKYRLVNSDRAIIGLARQLGIPFLFVFYEEEKLTDQDFVLLIWVKEEVELLDLNGASLEGQAVQVRVCELKEFLRCAGYNSFEDCWRKLKDMKRST
ncbi:MAG: hypothetical protein ABDH29_00635 [Aquificaceae bacterium]